MTARLDRGVRGRRSPTPAIEEVANLSATSLIRELVGYEPTADGELRLTGPRIDVTYGPR